ncbi:hypothetical protein [Flavobacterium sp. '19STA2R22 D10 B1']|uniref:hypothetical protein n=1 Tax=Flavobacterium aerium TaxID=3037261 RepID=UPI00278C318A|nr:hypothetical protein [Flavobacterium sp. '19STA2R22 D10 B1']
MKRRHEQKLVIITLILIIGMNMPILLLFDGAHSFLGFPVIYIYIFSLWLISVLASYLIIKKYYE